MKGRLESRNSGTVRIWGTADLDMGLPLKMKDVAMLAPSPTGVESPVSCGHEEHTGVSTSVEAAVPSNTPLCRAGVSEPKRTDGLMAQMVPVDPAGASPRTPSAPPCALFLVLVHVPVTADHEATWLSDAPVAGGTGTLGGHSANRMFPHPLQ